MKKSILFIFASGFCYVLWWMSMNYVGYCHAEGRFLSDEEKIDSAIKWALIGYPPSIRKDIYDDSDGVIRKIERWDIPKNPIFYKGVRDFRALNPDCCRLSMRTGEGGRPDFIDRISGYVATYVLVQYKVRYMEGNDEKYGMGGTAIAVKNCGQSWSGL